MRKVLGIVIFGLLLACKETPTYTVKNQMSGEVFGTTYSIILFTNSQIDYQRQVDSIFTVINQSLSTYIPGSDISRINAGDTTVVVDAMFREVFDVSRIIYNQTGGYFDPTVGNLVNAWGFGPENAMVMTKDRVDSLLTYVGFDKVAIREDGTVSKKIKGMYFDFNAIAKGYAIDRVAVLFDNLDISNYLIEIGGEIVAKGIQLEKQKPWVVGIDNPEADEDRSLKRIIKLQDRALASSGNYRKYSIDSVTGEKYVHTIDPITGYSKNSKTLGVNILASSCVKADGYATGLMVMDIEKAKALALKEKDMEAYIIYVDDAGSVQEFFTAGFKEVIVK